MGNRTMISYTGAGAIITKTQALLLRRLIKSNDESENIELVSKGKYYELISAYAIGDHGAFKTLTDDNVMKKLTPIFGVINVLYHDYDAPQILRYTLVNKKGKKIENFGGVF